MLAGIILLVLALVFCAAFVGVLVYLSSSPNSDFDAGAPVAALTIVLMIGTAILSVIFIVDAKEGYPVYYTDSNGLKTGGYRVVGTFEDNGRPYLAAVKDGEERVKVFALYAPLPVGTKRIKVDASKTGPEMITVDNSAEASGQK